MDYLLQERLKIEFSNKFFWNTKITKNIYNDVFNVDLTLSELNDLNNNIIRK